MQESGEVAQILKRSKTSSEALSGLLDHHRQQSSKWSLSFLGARSGVSSKGYLSEVLRGKKTLHTKYIPGICKAFRLSNLEAEYFGLLVECDREKCEIKQAALHKKQASLRKQMKVKIEDGLADYNDWLFAFAVFAAFGVVKAPVTFDALVGHFGLKNRGRVQAALDRLHNQELVEKAGNGAEWRLNLDQVKYGSGLGTDSHLKFLQQFFQYVSQNSQTWFTRNQEALIESSVLSCQRSHYLEAVEKLRNYVFELQSDLESSEGDEIVLFGVQMLPYQ